MGRPASESSRRHYGVSHERRPAAAGGYWESMSFAAYSCSGGLGWQTRCRLQSPRYHRSNMDRESASSVCAAGLQELMGASFRPLHLLALGAALADDGVHRGLRQVRRAASRWRRSPPVQVWGFVTGEKNGGAGHASPSSRTRRLIQGSIARGVDALWVQPRQL